MCYRLRDFFESLEFFFHVIYPFSLFVPFAHFTSKVFRFLCIRLLCPCAFFSYLLVEFSFVTLESPVLTVMLVPVSISFKYSFFWFIPSNCIVRFVCCFLPKHFCLSQFLYLSFLHYFQSRFLFGFLRGTPILSEDNFASAEISSFNSVMLSVGIFGNDLSFQYLSLLFSSLGSWGMLI